MRLVYRRTRTRGPFRVTVGRSGPSVSVGKGRARVGVGRAGVRGSLRLLRGLSARW